MFSLTSKILISILFISFYHLTYSQCSGNLGDNIFTDGDFGSGVSNILIPDPQIAPGYSYQNTPPPYDGEYCITNNTSIWGGFGEYWANINDNSPDPNGYMMVVNCDYEPGLFYEELVENLCENTLYVFSVDIFNLSDGIRPNVSFLIDGINQYTTGDIPYNFQWNTYGFTFTTSSGQNSVTLALQNNAEGGIGNDLALDNISFRACGPTTLILPEDITNICEDDSELELEATIIGTLYDTPHIQWQQSFDQGNTWVNIMGANNFSYIHNSFSSNFYYYRYLLANEADNLLNNKCRVISNTKIIEVVPKFYSITDTICEGLSYTLGNQSYSSSGTYTDSLISSIGCDSIVTLHLTTIPHPDIIPIFDYQEPNCYNEQNGYITLDTILNGTPPFEITINNEASSNGTLYNIGHGNYTYTFTDAYGCLLETNIEIINPPLFEIDLGEDISITLGETIELTPNYSIIPETIEWYTAESSSICEIDNCYSLEWTPYQSSILYVTATTNKGCTATNSIDIEVDDSRYVYIPNSFSPNSDGYNDFFTIYSAVPNVEEIEYLGIFDRWGTLVYENHHFLPNNETLGWDGRYNNTELPSGVYIYSAKIRFLDQKVIEYQGDVTLIK